MIIDALFPHRCSPLDLVVAQAMEDEEKERGGGGGGERLRLKRKSSCLLQRVSALRLAFSQSREII